MITENFSSSEDELILIAENIHDISTITLNLYNLPATIRILNLHGNLISNTNGLQISNFQGLIELNLSSNSITSCNLPELSFLSHLEFLDLSANLISTTNGFPFMSSLKKLFLSYNLCVDLHELCHSLPSLQCIDIRNNLISDVHQLSSLFELKVLKSINIGGGFSPNPLSGKATEMMKLFDNIPTLVDIDNEHIEFWKNKENQSTKELSNSIVLLLDGLHNKDNNDIGYNRESIKSQPITGPTLSSSSINEITITTPKFNLLLEQFKARSNNTNNYNRKSHESESENISSVYPNQAIRSKIDSFLNKKFKNDLLRISTTSVPTSADPTASSSSSNSRDAITNNPINRNHSLTVPNRNENISQHSYLGDDDNTHTSIKYTQPRYKTGNDKSTNTSDVLYSLTKVYVKYTFDQYIERLEMKCAFQKLSHAAQLRNVTLSCENLIENAVQKNNEISITQSAELKEIKDYCQRSQQHSKLALDIAYHRQARLESLNNEYEKLSKAKEIAHQQIIEERETKVREVHTLLEEQTRRSQTLEDSLALMSSRYNTLLSDYNAQKKEYEINLLKEQNEFDKYLQLHLAEEKRREQLEISMEKLIQLNKTSEASHQAEIASLTQRNVVLEEEMTILDEKLHASLLDNQQLHIIIQQLRNEKMNEANSFSNQLDTLRNEAAEYQKHSRHSDGQKLKYVKIIDQLSSLLRKQKLELHASQDREESLRRQLADLNTTFNIKIANEYTSKHDHQLVVKENDALKTEVENLKRLYKKAMEDDNSSVTISPPVIPSDSYDTDMHSRLKIKDKMLEDQNSLIYDLREKLGSYDKQIKILKRDLKEAESFLEEAKADISDLETQLKIKHEIEQNLNELVSQMQSETQQGGNRLCQYCSNSLDETKTDLQFNIFDEGPSINTTLRSATSSSSSLPIKAVSKPHVADDGDDGDDVIRIKELELDLIQLNEKFQNAQESKRLIETELQALCNQKREEIAKLEMKLTASESEQLRLSNCLSEEKMQFNISKEHSKMEKKKLYKHIKKLQQDLHSKDSQYVEAKKILLACLHNI